jgi:hypothetical protein
MAILALFAGQALRVQREATAMQPRRYDSDINCNSTKDGNTVMTVVAT